MKNLFIYITLLITATTLGYSLAPVTVVLNNDGDNITAQLNDYSTGSAVPVGNIGAITVPTITPNGSGYSSFVVGEGDPDWGSISSTKVNSNVILDVYDGTTLVAQFRLDELQEITARNERLPSDVTVGDELKVEGGSTFEGDATFEGEATFEGGTTFEGQLEVTGVFVQASNEFTDSVEIGDITSNIMIFVGDEDVVIEDESFSADLVNGATYTIINNGTGQNNPSLSFDLDNGYAWISRYQAVTIIKLGGKLYIVSQPGFGG
ncbi:MAG: hypothetical protein WC121_03690 [Candidatus Kapaibacterium sp.]